MSPLISDAEPGSISDAMATKRKKKSAFNHALALRLQNLRRERAAMQKPPRKPYSQTEIARAMGVSDKAVQRYENPDDGHGMSLEAALRLAQFYDMSVEDMVNGAAAANDLAEAIRTIKDAGALIMQTARAAQLTDVLDAASELVSGLAEPRGAVSVRTSRPPTTETPQPPPKSPVGRGGVRRRR